MDQHFEPEDELALGYLMSQFPSEYAVPEKPKPGPSQAELNAKERKEMLSYSDQVVEEAKSYQESLIQKEKDAEE